MLPPCLTEDSTNCYWDAATMGNGLGESFIAYQFDITPIVIVAIAGIVASIAIGIVAFVKRAR